MSNVYFVPLWIVTALGLTGISLILAGLGILLWRIDRAQGAQR